MDRMSVRGNQGIRVEERPSVSGDTDWEVSMKMSVAETRSAASLSLDK